MNDRERILMHSINLIAMDAGRGAIGREDAFLRYNESVRNGDLVLCQTGISPWKIAWMEEYKGNGNALLREVGGPKLCNYGNENYLRIDYARTIYAEHFLEGAEYKLACKIRKAVGNLEGYWHRIHSINFEGIQTWECMRPCSVTFRGHTLVSRNGRYTIPVKWNKRTPIKDIEQQLTDGGYGKDEMLEIVG